MKYPIQVLFREYFEGILAAVFLALFLRFFVISILYMPTNNMEPNLKRGDFIIGWRLAYGFPLPLMRGERLNSKVPEAGDMISFRFPGDEDQTIIRRVVGLPGDKIKITNGRIFVNDHPLILKEEKKGVFIEQADSTGKTYKVRHNPEVEIDSLQVPENSLFVLADNRFKADDSRDWGFVPIKNVESKISWIWLSVDNSQPTTQIRWPRLFQWVH